MITRAQLRKKLLEESSAPVSTPKQESKEDVVSLGSSTIACTNKEVGSCSHCCGSHRCNTCCPYEVVPTLLSCTVALMSLLYVERQRSDDGSERDRRGDRRLSPERFSAAGIGSYSNDRNRRRCTELMLAQQENEETMLMSPVVSSSGSARSLLEQALPFLFLSLFIALMFYVNALTIGEQGFE
ncbi:hypothetical protein TTRE_0000605901 [Trichuris trichiura]|uniref:Uncharacterized protein n=1 Tax=Trichuris trichiura TaxID=36087 RepID=A0A077ZD49_TRITR|nr:hypothetical protein TTRE_0000605901 [Trichuris trichiura]